MSEPSLKREDASTCRRLAALATPLIALGILAAGCGGGQSPQGNSVPCGQNPACRPLNVITNTGGFDARGAAEVQRQYHEWLTDHVYVPFREWRIEYFDR